MKNTLTGTMTAYFGETTTPRYLVGGALDDAISIYRKHEVASSRKWMDDFISRAKVRDWCRLHDEIKGFEKPDPFQSLWYGSQRRISWMAHDENGEYKWTSFTLEQARAYLAVLSQELSPSEQEQCALYKLSN